MEVTMRQKMSEKRKGFCKGVLQFIALLRIDGVTQRDGLIVSTKIKFLNGIMKPHLATALKSEKLQSLTLSLTWIYKLKYIFGALPRSRRPGGVTREGIGLKLLSYSRTETCPKS